MHVKLRPRTRLLERVYIFSKKQPFCSVVPNNLTFGLFEMSVVEICFADEKCDIEIDHGAEFMFYTIENVFGTWTLGDVVLFLRK